VKRTRSLAVVTAAWGFPRVRQPVPRRREALDSGRRAAEWRHEAPVAPGGGGGAPVEPSLRAAVVLPLLPITADLSTVDAEALTWELPEGEEPVLTLTFDRDPGPAAERRLPLLPRPCRGVGVRWVQVGRTHPGWTAER
jgi:hypothetical protein